MRALIDGMSEKAMMLEAKRRGEVTSRQSVDCGVTVKVFHVLKWASERLERAIAALLEAGAIQELTVRGAKNLWLVSNRFLD